MESKSLVLVTPIYPPDIGGPATYTKTLSDKLPQVKQVVSFTDNPKIVSIPKKFPLIRQLFLLLALLRSKEELLYAQDPLVTGLAAGLAGKIKKKTTITKVVGDVAWEAYQDRGGNLSLEDFLKIKKSFRCWLTQVSLNLADQIIVPCAYLKDILKTYYKIEGRKIVVIPNFTAVKPKTATSKSLLQKKNTIIYLGRLKPWKNIDHLILAFSQLKNSDWELLIVGSGNQEKKLKHLVDSLELKDTIKFKSHAKRSLALKLLSQSKILVLPSSYEGFPHVILEAAKLNTAVIASDIPSHKELIVDKENGLLFPLGNIQELSKKIDVLIKHPDNIKDVTRSLRSTTRRYNLRNHLKNLKEVILASYN